MDRPFSINIQPALLILGFRICGFKQPWIKNSIFDLLLEIQGFRGPTVCIALHYFIQRTWASADLGGACWNHPSDTKGQTLSFWRVKIYTWFLDCMGVGLVPLTSALFKDHVYTVVKVMWVWSLRVSHCPVQCECTGQRETHVSGRIEPGSSGFITWLRMVWIAYFWNFTFNIFKLQLTPR